MTGPAELIFSAFFASYSHAHRAVAVVLKTYHRGLLRHYNWAEHCHVCPRMRIQPRRNNGDADVPGTSTHGATSTDIEPEISDSKKRRDDAEINEQEIDQLYSTVRRSSLRNIDCDSSIAGPSHVCLEDAITDAQSIRQKSLQHGDEESNSSQEPSYRYITVRENAHVVRERLRQQGQLAAPARDHYYSVIGNEYETVGDAQNSTYNTLLEPQTSGAISLDLNVSHSREFVPPPPTSPIPDRSLNCDNKGECSGESTFSSARIFTLALIAPTITL
ncbi:hypothetical protein TELCIR_12673 [Teladorsagia circumcincta]|uniref:Uncharacterized protein n=1 Tax=Teladorsagia circumcincta TaxID=45464 RepID=A0A2G9U5S2_TELCI|nr:hypothetical protein TELCIR_12673 [Teladorsagia circumcincta]